MSPESDAKYEAWKIREQHRQDNKDRLRTMYADLRPKPKPKPAKVEPEQLPLFTYDAEPTENGHTL